MAKTVNEVAGNPQEDLNVKKPKTSLTSCSGPVDAARRAILATGEFYQGLAEASAEAIRSFDNELQSESVQSSGLTNKIVDGIAESNVRFFEVMAESSRRSLERLRAETQDQTKALASEIDYEKLAKLVAAELKKTGSST
jgi:hypothetical protein